MGATVASLAGCGKGASTTTSAPTPATAAGAATLSPSALSSVYPFGANTFLGSEVDLAKRERTVQLMKAAHIGWLKEQVPLGPD